MDLLTTWALPVHYALALTLLWSCFCRFTYTSKGNTRWAIRWSLNLMVLAAVACLAVPIITAQRGDPWIPDRMHLLMLTAITLVQVATSSHWKRGVPPAYQRSFPPPMPEEEGVS